MKKAVIYNRCSTEEEAQINALAIQAEESREIVFQKGWQLIGQYIESESGTTVQKRSEYRRLLEDMETDGFDIVVIKSIDRLMRSAKDWYLFLDKLTQNHKELYIYMDHKFYTPDDSLLTGIKAILAEDFSRELSKKIKNSHRRRQSKKSGLNITVPMFGWDKVGKDTFILNEKEAEAYRLAFALAKEGKGFYSIANIMYDKGIRSKKGAMISAVQWRKMLYSSRAHGTVTLHTWEYDFEEKKRRKVPENEWIYVEDALPPIVGKEYQMEVLEAISSRTRSHCFHGYTRDMTTTGLYALSGKIYCGVCGKVYYRSSFVSGRGTLTEWKCSTALKQGRKTGEHGSGCSNIHVIEDVILEKLEESCRQYYEELFGREDDMVEETMRVLGKVLAEKGTEKEAEWLQKELTKLEKKKNVLIQKLIEEVIRDEAYQSAMEELTEKGLQLQSRLERIVGQIEKEDHCRERLCKIKDALEDGLIDKAKTKEIISRIHKILIYPNGTMEILFDQVKMISLLNLCGAALKDREMDPGLFRITVPYEHKNNIARRRERINGEILDLLRNSPELTLKEVAAAVKMSDSYVHASMRELKEKSLVRYKRGNRFRAGRWMVEDSF